jgi:hypothetical protein
VKLCKRNALTELRRVLAFTIGSLRADDLPEQAFLYVGALEEVRRSADTLKSFDEICDGKARPATPGTDAHDRRRRATRARGGFR